MSGLRRSGLRFVVFGLLGALAAPGCSDDSPGSGTDECGPNHPCPSGFTCDTTHQPTRCIASQNPGKVTFSLAIAGGGTVAVSGSAACTESSCSYSLNQGSSVTLTATPAAGSQFVAWSGDCSGTTSTITVTLEAGRSCTASFAVIDPTRFTVTVSAPSGGTISTTPALTCSGGTCTGSVAPGTALSLTATAAAGFRFTGWSGSAACDGKTDVPLALEVTANLMCTAGFVRRVTVSGAVQQGLSGAVTATAADASSTCTGSSCVADAGKQVTLVAPTVAGHRLAGWTGTGCDAGTASGSGLTLVAAADITCTATYAVGVSVSGTVVGAVGQVIATSTSAGAQCASGSCAIDQGGDVSLAAPDLAPASRFLGWSGDPGCTGTARDITLVAVTHSTTCTATYVARFTVAAVAGANGSVAAAAAGQTCSGGSCTVDAGTGVTLTATADAGFHFGGWTGTGCTPADMNPLVLTDVNATCTAAFAADPLFAASAVTAPAGVIAITATAPAGTCASGRCTSVPPGTQVTFAFNAGAVPRGYHFVDWSANCRGATPASTATVTVTADITCTAAFRIDVNATTSPAHGTLAAVPASCPQGGTSSVCVVDPGTTVSFTVTPQSGWRFVSWSGARCTASGTQVTVTAATQPTTCTANLASTSWATSYREAGGNAAHGTGLAQVDASTFAVVAASSLGTEASRWILPIHTADGSDVTPAQFSGPSLPTNSISNGIAEPTGDIVNVSGDLAWTARSADGLSSPLVVRASLPAGTRFAVTVPFVQTGATVASDAPVGLAASGQSLWVGSTLALTSPTGAAPKRFARLTQLSQAGAVTADILFSLRSPVATCAPAAAAPFLSTILAAFTDVGDGLFLVLTDDPADSRYFLVIKVKYDGTAVWTKRASVNGAFGTRIARAVATSGGGAAIVGNISNDGGRQDAFYMSFTGTGAAGFSGGVYGHALDDFGSGSQLLAAAVDRGGGLALVGTATVPNAAAAVTDAWLVITRADGSLAAQRAYGGAGNDFANGVALPSDGGYLVTGTTTSFGGTDVWAVRADDALHVAFTAASGAAERVTASSVIFDANVVDATCAVTPQPVAGDVSVSAMLSASALAPILAHQAP